MGWDWEPIGSNRWAHYNELSDHWEIMAPKETHRLKINGGYERIPVHERTYLQTGVRSYPNRIEVDETAKLPPSFAFPWMRKTNSHTITEGSCYDVYSREGYQSYWRSGPIKTIAGRGTFTVKHNGYISGGVTVSFSERARIRTINKEKWLEKRRQRAVAEKSLKVINKLGSVAAETLPEDFRFDLDKASEAYQNLLLSLHPDCPSVSSIDMEYFGQCVLWQAKQRDWAYRLPVGHGYRRDPSKADLDRAFDTMRTKLRTHNYKTDYVYEYEDDTTFDLKVTVNR